MTQHTETPEVFDVTVSFTCENCDATSEIEMAIDFPDATVSLTCENCKAYYPTHRL